MDTAKDGNLGAPPAYDANGQSSNQTGETQAPHVSQPQAAYPVQPQAAYPKQPEGAYPTQPGAYPVQPNHPPPYTLNETQNMTTTTIVGQPTTILAPLTFGPVPLAMVCPHCNAQIVTTVSRDTGVLPWLVCCGLCAVGCWYGCCLIPFCIEDLQDCKHTCPNCQKCLGVYKRL
ncbi:lipopolysaccharide-induced tumor necrosis factor-alpha factor homolog isoform X5 [Xenia sp. Carnegie-2017]|uniref:lipopolysaccharide-induced tumor necrosis factor-alpha factor homolog isoform X5 n=1 Tax=Xenia sp. Carnegie-2017 TaxID=2897299 RepID=UPI001F0388D7|nr:lipopolysaccharide-induced tumor necrosis factor-alpha factor homolog isoform X5 [Xenia sp. Carnegie-2017]